MRRIKRHWQLIWVMLLALVLRLISIQSRGIIYDDTFSLFLAQRSLAEIVSGTAADTMPPLYYILLHFWMQGSGELWWLRLLSVLISLGIVYLLSRLTAALFNEKAGLWAGLFAAISPLQIYHAQDIRMYALVVLAQLGYYWFFYRCLWQKDDRPAARWEWIGLVLCGTAALFTHNLAIFGLAAANFALLWRRDWRGLGRLILAQLLMALLALPWLLFVPGQIAKIQRAFWTPRPGFVEVFQALLQYTLQLPLGKIGMLVGAILSVQVLVFTILFSFKEPRNRPGILMMTSLAVIPPLLLFIASYLIRPVFVARGFLVASLAYYALVASTVERTWNKGIGVFVAAALIISAAISLPALYTYAEFPRSPFAAAGSQLADDLQPDDIVLHDNKLSYFPMRFFEPDLNQVFLPDQPGSANDTFALPSQQAMGIFPVENIEAAIEGKERVFFVVFDETIREYQQMGLAEHPLISELEEVGDQLRQLRFGDLRVIEFNLK